MWSCVTYESRFNFPCKYSLRPIVLRRNINKSWEQVYRWGNPVSEAGAQATRSLALPLHLAAAPVTSPHCPRSPLSLVPTVPGFHFLPRAPLVGEPWCRAKLLQSCLPLCHPWTVACQALVHLLAHQGNLAPAGLGVTFRHLGKGKALLPSTLKHCQQLCAQGLLKELQL